MPALALPAPRLPHAAASVAIFAPALALSLPPCESATASGSAGCASGSVAKGGGGAFFAMHGARRCGRGVFPPCLAADGAGLGLPEDVGAAARAAGTSGEQPGPHPGAARPPSPASQERVAIPALSAFAARERSRGLPKQRESAGRRRPGDRVKPAMDGRRPRQGRKPCRGKSDSPDGDFPCESTRSRKKVPAEAAKSSGKKAAPAQMIEAATGRRWASGAGSRLPSLLQEQGP